MGKEKKKKSGLVTENELRKKYSSSSLASNLIVSGEEALWLPSKFIAVNHRLGGGILYGRILEIFGEESSGKSLLAYDFAEVAQSLGGIVLWVDAEGAYTTSWAESLGLDNSKVELYQETAVEMISDWIADMTMFYRSKLTNNEPILLVVDSTAALDTLENINSVQTDSKAEMGNRAKSIYKMLRIRNQRMNQMGVCTIFINQVRKALNAGMFGDPDTTPGGQAMKFYASQRLGITRGKQIKLKIQGKERRVGSYTHLRVVKNKVAPPASGISNAEVYFNDKFSSNIGFNPYSGLAEILEDAGVINRKAGSSHYKMGDKVIANGEEKFLELLDKNEKMRNKLIRKSEVNTVSRTRKQLKRITKNLYPL